MENNYRSSSKELVKWLLLGMLQLLWEYFGPKLCTFHTISSMIRVNIKQKCLTFPKNYPFVWGKKSKKGVWGVGVLVIVLSGLELKTILFGYGKKKVTWVDRSKTVFKVQWLTFIVHFKTLNVPTVYSFTAGR